MSKKYKKIFGKMFGYMESNGDICGVELINLLLN